MRLTSNTGLLAAIEGRASFAKQQSVPDLQLRCDVTPAPFMLRPYAGLYNPFSKSCSVLCNHPAHLGAKEHVRQAKECCGLDRKSQPSEDGDKDKIRTPHDIVTEDMFRRYAETDSRPLTPAPTLASGKSRGSRRCLTPDQPFAKTAIVLDLRRSHSQNVQLKNARPQTEQNPARKHIIWHNSLLEHRGYIPPLLAQGRFKSTLKSQKQQNLLPSSSDIQTENSRNLPPGQTANNLWLEPLGLNLLIEQIGCNTSLEQNIGHNPPLKQREHNPPLKQREYDPPLKPREHNPPLKQREYDPPLKPREHNPPLKQREYDPPLKPREHNAPLKQKRSNTPMTQIGSKPASKSQMEQIEQIEQTLSLSSLNRQETLYYHGHTTSDMTAHNTSPTNDRSTLPSLNLSEGAHARLLKGQCQLPPLASPLVLTKRQVKEPVTVRTAKKTQLKSLNLGKPAKSKSKSPPTSQRSKTEKEGSNEAIDDVTIDEGEGDGDGKRRGKRRKKGRNGSDRLTSAGLAAQAQQDPETQIAGIGTDSQNPSSRGSIAPSVDDDIILPIIKPVPMKKMMDSFLDDDILKYLHREVDEAAIETEFDIKRRYVYEEALRTKPERAYGSEMQSLLKEMKMPTMSLGDWLHIPRVFSRQNAQFSLPLDSNALETLSPMNYAARFVNLKRSKQLLYLTVLRKFKDKGYRMPIKNIEEGLMLMMGGILTPEMAAHLRKIMEFDSYVEESCIPDEIKLTVLGWKRSMDEAGDANEMTDPTLKYRTWCGLCAICERMFGRFPPRSQDPPDGIELSDFSMVENRLAVLKVHKGLVEVLNTIRER